ncbi:hypothetical protein GJAV_G00122270 [Gymnothorax javanicus]|nr:hypothetical protein GJAV_G00122270 [Gymnothorax javanicus]
MTDVSVTVPPTVCSMSITEDQGLRSPLATGRFLPCTRMKTSQMEETQTRLQASSENGAPKGIFRNPLHLRENPQSQPGGVSPTVSIAVPVHATEPLTQASVSSVHNFTTALKQPPLVEKLPIPPWPTTAYTTKTIKRKQTKDERQALKRELTRARDKTRISIGSAFQRWRELRDLKGFRNDAELAVFLLDTYQAGSLATTPTKRRKITERTGPRPALSCTGDESLSESDDDLALESPGFSEAEETTVQVLDTSTSALDIHDNIEWDFNHIRNSVIDWAEGSTWSPGEATGDVLASEDKETLEEDPVFDDSDDKDHVPPFRVRAGGDMRTEICLDALQSISVEDTVHDAVDAEPMEQPPVPGTIQIQSEDDILGHPASIAYHDSLKQLAAYLLLPISLCSARDQVTSVECLAPGPFKIQTKARGTAVIIQWICPNNHCVWQWNSQPTFRYGMQAGDFMLASNILLSGNNYAKVALLFKFMNMGIVERSTFLKIQDTNCVDTITDFWHEKRAEMLSKLQPEDNVVVLADGCVDTPGSCAQYCTSSAMEINTREIISIVNIAKEEMPRSSVAMEREGFIKIFDKLHEEVKLAEVCTDTSSQISTLFNPSKGKYKDSGVCHTLDIWHGVKKLSKKILAAGRQEGCSILLQWNKDVCNHFWYCCKTAESHDDFCDMWVDFLTYATGRQISSLRARYSHLEDDRERAWIEVGTVPYEVLSAVILSESWVNEVHKYLNFRSTAELESFHNHIRMYASEPFSFTPPIYEARVLLAGLDYNHHVRRPPKRRPDGTMQYRKLYNKKSAMWRLYSLKEEKDYSYIPELQRAIIRKWVSLGCEMPQGQVLSPR